MIPSLRPADLTEPARALYRDITRYGDRADHDINPGDQQRMALATEIAEAGLGTLRVDATRNHATLTVVPLARFYSVADPGGDLPDDQFFADVHLLRSPTDEHGTLLASLRGATFADRTPGHSPVSAWDLTVRHRDARDADHSLCYLAALTVHQPVFTYVSGTAMTVVGSLGADPRLYTAGVDPLLLNTHATSEVMDEPEICTDCAYGDGPDRSHPRAPYRPPAREEISALVGRFVRIEFASVNAVAPNGLRLGKSLVTHVRD